MKARKPEYLSLKIVSMTFVHADQPSYLSTNNRTIKYSLKIQDKTNASFSLPTNLSTIFTPLQRKASKAFLLKHAFDLHICNTFAFIRTVGEEKINQINWPLQWVFLRE